MFTNLALVQKWPTLSHFHHRTELPGVPVQWYVLGTCTGSPWWCCRPCSWTAACPGRWVLVWGAHTAWPQPDGQRSYAVSQPHLLPLHNISRSAMSPSKYTAFTNIHCRSDDFHTKWREQCFVILHSKIFPAVYPCSYSVSMVIMHQDTIVWPQVVQNPTNIRPTNNMYPATLADSFGEEKKSNPKCCITFQLVMMTPHSKFDHKKFSDSEDTRCTNMLSRIWTLAMTSNSDSSHVTLSVIIHQHTKFCGKWFKSSEDMRQAVIFED